MEGNNGGEDKATNGAGKYVAGVVIAVASSVGTGTVQSYVTLNTMAVHLEYQKEAISDLKFKQESMAILISALRDRQND